MADAASTASGRFEPLAIVGVGCLFPRAGDFAAFWANVKNGVDAITPVPPTHWNPSDYHDPDPKTPDKVYAARGGFLDPVAFPPGDYGIAPNNLEATDTSQLLGLVAARQALADARLLESEQRTRTATILGVTGTLELVIPLGARLGHPLWRRALRDAGVPDDVANDVISRIADGYVGWQENSFPGLLGNVVAGRIANRFDLGGTNCVVDAACASSLGAVHLAALELAAGRADAVLTGGIDTFNDVFMFTCFSKTPALSPTGDARPFDANGDGTILGEGLGLVILKRLADAERDGDDIYAVLRGLGTSSDGKGNAVYAPKAAGQVECLRRAYESADISPATVELVEAHGTGTKVGDATEVSALAEVYRASGRSGTWCALGSIKSQIGHTKAAAGAAGLLKAVAALHHKVLPPTLKVRRPLDLLAPAQSPLYVNAEKRPWLQPPDHPRRAAVSAFGFGGSNFHCVVEEYRPEKAAPDWDGNVQILALSGDSIAALDQELAAWPANLPWPEVRARCAAARHAFSPRSEHRVVIVLDRQTDPSKRLAEARQRLSGTVLPGSAPIFVGRGTAEGGVALLFPGQGAQSVGMLRDLACLFPQMLAALSEADRTFHAATGKRLGDLIYPPSAFDENARSAQETALRATDVAQPALGAVAFGAWRVLESFGLRPTAALGHSYGELAALCSAGRLTTTELHSLSLLRGRLMNEAGDRVGDRGSMLAVHAPLEAIRAMLAEEGLELTLANKNAPDQTVLSGATPEIDRAEAALTRRGLRSTRLPVAAAFHSPRVAAAEPPFRAAMESVAFSPGRFPVIANSTAEPYPDATDDCQSLLGGQLARPVEFVACVERLYADGVRTFVEVGPGARLSGLVRATLGDRPHQAVAVDASNGKRDGIFDLACCLAALAAEGREINLSLWDADCPPPPAPPTGFVVPISGANYVKPKPARPATPPRPVPVPAPAPVPVAPPSAPMPSMNPNPTPPVPTVSSTTTIVASPPPRAQIDGGALSQALQVTRESLALLQKMQEQTAQIHRQFLEGQETAHRTVHLLFEQQQRLLQAAAGSGQQSAISDQRAAIGNQQSAISGQQSAISNQRSAGSGQRAEVNIQPVGVRQPDSIGVTTPVVEPVPNLAPESAIRNPHLAIPLGSAIGKAESVLVEVIAEKTGYPTEMLNLDMSLDSDLGIDSIKRVEILSALQERLPEAPTVKPEHLGTLQTLRQIVAFLNNGESEAGTGAPATNSAAPAVRSHPAGQAQETLLGVIAEKTGYPTEMLNLDMALDADLGIDSIKRVEILSALQERLPEAPTVKPEHLGTLQTLRQIVAFLQGGAAAPCDVTSARENRSDSVQYAGIEQPALAVTEPARILNRSVLRLAPVSATRRRHERLPAGDIVLIGENDEWTRRLHAELAGRGGHPRTLAWSDLAGGRAFPDSLAGLILLAPPGGTSEAMLRDALLAVRRASGAFANPTREPVLLTVSRMTGEFGLTGAPLARPLLDGGLAGLTKTAQREWPHLRAKALDLAHDLDVAGAAVAVVDELLADGPIEVGLSRQGPQAITRVEQPLQADHAKLPWQPGDVVLVTGGARGVTAEAAIALARSARPTLVLLGRSPAPGPEPEWLAPLVSEPEIKRELGLRLNGDGSLKRVGDEYRRVAAEREVRANLKRIEAAGAKVRYRSVDVRDAAAVAEVANEIRRSIGPIRGLIHGAGVLADARIADKTAEQFDQVFGVKVGGLHNLLAVLPTDELRGIALFSSITGREGRVGQADYAMANEVLNKEAQRLAGHLPQCKVVSINWGPWDGGMVTPGLKRVFGSEGVGLIPLDAGARFLVQELAVGRSEDVEITVLAESDESTADSPAREEPVHRTQSSSSLPLAFERSLSLEECPVLEAHVLDGRPVLPLALTLEWLAHGALHANPGLAFHGVDDLRVLHGVLLQDEAISLRVHAGKARRQDDHYLAAVELVGSRENGRPTLHARAEVVLATNLPATPAPGLRPVTAPYGHEPATIYESFLFHGPEFHAIHRVEACDRQGLAAQVRCAPPPGAWLRRPLRQRWLADPLALDAAFQLVLLWGREHLGLPGLPNLVRRYRQFQRNFPTEGMRALLSVTRSTSATVVADIELLDLAGRLVARLDGCECTFDPGLDRAYRNNRLLASTSA